MFSPTPAESSTLPVPVWDIVERAASRLPRWIHDEVFSSGPPEPDGGGEMPSRDAA